MSSAAASRRRSPPAGAVDGCGWARHAAGMLLDPAMVLYGARLARLAPHAPTAHPAAHPPLRSRVMLKVSGEALEGTQGFGIDPQVLQTIASEVAAAASEGVQIAIVVGGGK